MRKIPLTITIIISGSVSRGHVFLGPRDNPATCSVAASHFIPCKNPNKRATNKIKSLVAIGNQLS